MCICEDGLFVFLVNNYTNKKVALLAYNIGRILEKKTQLNKTDPFVKAINLRKIELIFISI